MDFSSFTFCFDNFGPFQQPPAPPSEIFSQVLEPNSAGLFDGQDMHGFYQRDVATGTDGHNADFWYYDLPDFPSLLEPPESTPNYELFGSAPNEPRSLLNEAGIALEGAIHGEIASSSGSSGHDAPTGCLTEATSVFKTKIITIIQARQGLGFSLHFSSQAAIDSGSASVIVTFPDNPGFFILFYPASNPEALQWSQLALQANIVSDSILTMDDGSLFLRPGASCKASRCRAPAGTPTSPGPQAIDHAIPTTPASPLAPTVEGATSSTGPSTAAQAEDLSDAIPVAAGVLMIGSKNRRQTLPAAALKRMYAHLAVVSVVPGAGKRETRYHCSLCEYSEDGPRIQDFSRHRNNKHRAVILEEEYTPRFLCATCGQISARKDIAKKHWEEICGRGRVGRGGYKKADREAATRKRASTGDSKKAGRRRSKMGLISS
ncbi:hypothetical protein HWV62_1378 [Athelia sp. TMB]|nr:hypothetical protein HWV62_1378 [Athelia sp. TMB]